MNVRDAKDLRKAPLETPTDLGSNAVRDISGALNVLLADMFGLATSENQEFPLAHIRSTFPRLSSSAR